MPDCCKAQALQQSFLGFLAVFGLMQGQGKIPLCGIRQQGNNGFPPVFLPPRKASGRQNRRAGGYAHKQTLPGRKLTGAARGFFPGNGDPFIDHGAIQNLWRKSRADTGNFLSRSRLHRCHPDISLFLEIPACPGNRPSCAGTGNKNIHFP